MQSTPYTCSESSLMVGLHELTGSPINAQVEVGIWKAMLPWYLKPLEKFLQKFVGTPPRCLVSYIQKHEPKVVCEYFVYRKNLKPMEKRAWLIGFLSNAHDVLFALLMPLRPRARTSRAMQTAEDVLRLLAEKPGCRLLLVIVIAGGFVHFVLVRRDGPGTVVVMDPYHGKGTNTSFDNATFAATYGPVLYGYSMRLTKV
jgi:hypothetical protein